MTILLFGATGSAGGSVLRVGLASPDVTEVRAIVRRPTGLADPKLREIVHADYLSASERAPRRGLSAVARRADVEAPPYFSPCTCFTHADTSGCMPPFDAV